MGTVCIGFESAQRAWRSVGEQIARANPASESVPPLLIRLLFDEGRSVNLDAMPMRSRATKIPARVDVEALGAYRATGPQLSEAIQLCVSSRKGRRFVAGAECRLVTGSYPPGSFSKLADTVLVTSPELTFLQMARSFDFDALVLYGYELCGYYVRTDEGAGFCSCPRLTSTGRIAEYLDRLTALRERRGEGMPWGLGPARRALRHIHDGAASPEEATVLAILTYPTRLGGYGLPPARLNERVRLGAETARLFGIDSFVCDLSWDNGRRVLEYQGSQHKQRSRRTYDLRKGNVLVADGRSLVQMNRAMLARHDLMDEVAKSLTVLLDLTWREPSATVATRRMRLRNKLIKELDKR